MLVIVENVPANRCTDSQSQSNTVMPKHKKHASTAAKSSAVAVGARGVRPPSGLNKFVATRRAGKTLAQVAAGLLARFGVVVVPALSPLETLRARQGVATVLAESHEFVEGFKGPYVGGSHGAFGHPTSMHHPVVRGLRGQAHQRMRDIVKEVVKDKRVRSRTGEEPPVEWWFLSHADQVLVREKAFLGEPMHRDCSPHADPLALVYGGWVNLDAHPQEFSCAPGTHIPYADAWHDLKLKTASINHVLKEQRYFEVLHEFDVVKQNVQVPPGYMLLFSNEILHEDLRTKASCRPMMQLRVACEATPNPDAVLMPDLEERLRQFAVLDIKSGRTPVMVPRTYAALQGELLHALTQGVVDEAKETTLKGVRRVKDVMPSLAQLGLGHSLPPYTAEEKAILTPSLLFEGDE